MVDVSWNRTIAFLGIVAYEIQKMIKDVRNTHASSPTENIRIQTNNIGKTGPAPHSSGAEAREDFPHLLAVWFCKNYIVSLSCDSCISEQSSSEDKMSINK